MKTQQYMEHASALLAAVSPTPRLDAEALVMHVTGWERAALIARAHHPLDTAERERLDALLARRATGEPVAYLTGSREFWSLPLAVTRDTLIPRPETELLVERALERIPRDAPWRIADLGTGSGAIALAIASERPGAHIIATDICPAALEVAAQNAARLGITNIEFRHGHWLEPLSCETFDAVLSNPPYVRAGDPHLSQGDVRFEPPHALAAGPDGLEAIRAIARAARAHIRPGGWLLIEHGYDQGTAVAALLRWQGYGEVSLYRDLASQERVSEASLVGPASQ